MIRTAHERTKALAGIPWFWWFSDTGLDLNDASLEGRRLIVDHLSGLYMQMDGYRLNTHSNVCTGRPEPHMLFDAVEHSALYVWWQMERDELSELKAMQEFAA